MNFFEGITPLLSNEQSISMAIKKNKDGTLTVSIIPKLDVKDDAISKLKPLNATGTPEQLDTHLINMVTSPLKSTITLAQQVVNYEKHVKEVEKETKMKEGEKKANVTKVDKLLKEIDTCLEKKEFNKGIAKCNEALKIGEKKAEINKKLDSLKEQQVKTAPDIFTGPAPPVSEADKPREPQPKKDPEPVTGQMNFDQPGPAGVPEEKKEEEPIKIYNEPINPEETEPAI